MKTVFYFGGGLETTVKIKRLVAVGAVHKEGPSAVRSNQMGNKFRREKSCAESSRRSGKEAEKETSFLDSQCDLSQGSSLP